MKAFANLAIGAALVLLFLVLISPLPYGNSKEAAKRTVCLSNVKRQALGLILYADDGDGRFPARSAWMDATARYRKGDGSPDSILRCPVVTKGAFGYAFNAALSRASSPRAAETTPLVYESATLTRHASDLVRSLPLPGRHGGRNSVAYADGHAKAAVP